MVSLRSGSLTAGALTVGLASALLLTGCGNDNTAGGPAASGGASSSVACGGKDSLKASGSTAQANAMTRFIAAYESACTDNSLDYTSNGSGAGVSEFIGGQTDFGGSDSPLKEDAGEPAAAQKRCGSPAWNLPVVFGPLAVTYNVKGVDDLVLDGPTLGKIFSGGIKTWNDGAIAALNKGATLPNEKINVLYRSDESGTTDNFQKYLDGASDGSWTKGTGKTFAGGVGEGAKGNEGTSAAIKTTEGSITYNEWSFAQSQKLQQAAIITSAGSTPVKISTESVGKTVAGAKIAGSGNDLVLDTSSFYKPKDEGAYPIVLATYEIVCSKYSDKETGTAVRAFLQSTLTGGQVGLEDNGYIPVPDAFLTKLNTAVKAIR